MRESRKLSSDFDCYRSGKVEAFAPCVEQAHEALPQPKSCLRSIQRVFRLDTDYSKKSIYQKGRCFFIAKTPPLKISLLRVLTKLFIIDILVIKKSIKKREIK